MVDSALDEFQGELRFIHSQILRDTKDEANVPVEKLMGLVARNGEGRCQLNVRALSTLRINNIPLKGDVISRVAEFALNNGLMVPEQMSEFKRFGLQVRKASWGQNAFIVERPAYKIDTQNKYDGTEDRNGQAPTNRQGGDPTEPHVVFGGARRVPCDSDDHHRPLSRGDRTDRSAHARLPFNEGGACLMDKIHPGLGWNR